MYIFLDIIWPRECTGYVCRDTSDREDQTGSTTKSAVLELPRDVHAPASYYENV